MGQVWGIGYAHQATNTVECTAEMWMNQPVVDEIIARLVVSTLSIE